jgi:hypothetical protein
MDLKMDLKTQIQNSTLLRPDLKERLIANLDKLSEEQKAQILESLDVKALYDEAAKQIKKAEKGMVREIRTEVQDKESSQADENLDNELANL